MEQFILKMQEIIKKKIEELEVTSPDLIDYPILEDEIEDAARIWIILRSTHDDNKDTKLKEIQSIFNITTSSSIYHAVKDYFEKEEGIIL